MSADMSWVLLEALRQPFRKCITQRRALIVEGGTKVFLKRKYLQSFCESAIAYAHSMLVPYRVSCLEMRDAIQSTSPHTYSLQDNGIWHSGYTLPLPEGYPITVLPRNNNPLVQLIGIGDMQDLSLETSRRSAKPVSQIRDIPEELLVSRESHIIEIDPRKDCVARLTFDFGEVNITKHAFEQFQVRLKKHQPSTARYDRRTFLLVLIRILQDSFPVARKNAVIQIMRHNFNEGEYRLSQHRDTGDYWVQVITPSTRELATIYLKGDIWKLYRRIKDAK